MENHYRELLRFLSARLGDRHAAADVAHDAYLRVLERSSQAQIEHPKAFLYRTALNLAVDEHRRSRVRRAEPLEVLDDEEGLASPSPQTVVDQGQRLDNLQRALAELPAICRSSFLLR
ncbi:RNA polymerase sigma factor [Pseudomonas aeruginosa PS42]|nr:RNA polymerase sigma factor [Pseudomonas aeruginosa PS42]